MDTVLNDMINVKNGVYYEYRETFYRVDDQGNEHEVYSRETAVNCADLMRTALTTATKFVERTGSILHDWDLLTLCVIRHDSDGAKTVFEARLFASDFAEQ